MDGSTKRRSFYMKDGTEIYKGVMLEANLPPFFEDATLMDVAMMGLMGAGASMMSSDVAAYTGVSAGASPVALIALPLISPSGGQASAASFNTYGEYQTCTFSIANKSEYWDAMDQLLNLGERRDEPFRLNVIADQRIVKQIEVRNLMEPQTFTVPLYNCRSLTFWLEPRNCRSGQFVLYDMKVSKKPYQPVQQCWEVTYVQNNTEQFIYGFLTEEEVLENIAEMRADSTITDISYRPAKADNRQACEQLFDKR